MRRVVAALVGLTLALLGGASSVHNAAARIAQAHTSVTSRIDAQNARSLEKLPLRFERNGGQTDQRVRFLARGAGFTAFLTNSGAVLQLQDSSRAGQTVGQSHLRPRPTDVVSMSLVGAQSRTAMAGMHRLQGSTNYFIGNDPSRWRAGIAGFGAVRQRGVYPGVDLTYRGNAAHQLEYDFTVRPGASPAPIRMRFRGQRGISIGPDGALVLTLGSGILWQAAPVAYQVVGGSRRPVASSFTLEGDTVRFVVGRYDHALPLVIDPGISYSTYLGGSDFEFINDVSVDRFGNAYLWGLTLSADYPTTPGAFQPNFNGTQGETVDDFVSKLTPDGSALIYSTYLGGTDEDEAFGMAIDHAGDAYVAGPTLSTDFPTTPGVLQPTAPGGDHDGFVTKLNPTGSALVWSTYLGGSEHDAALTPVVDKAGDVFVIGDTNSDDLPATPGAFQTAPSGGDCSLFDEFDPGDCEEAGGLDAFVAELNPTASGLKYLTYLGASGDEVGLGIALDAGGNAYVALETTSTDWPVTPGAYQPAFAGGDGIDGVNSDNVIVKLNPTGTKEVYATYLGGSGDECFLFQCWVAVDQQGHAFEASQTTSTDFPTTPGTLQRANAGGIDQTVTKLNANGTGLIYATYLGGSGDESTVNARTLAVRQNGDAYVTGYTLSSDYPVVEPVQGSSAGGFDITLSVLNARASRLLFSTYFGGSGDDFGDLNIDAAGAAYLSGFTCSTDYPVTAGAFQTAAAGGCDAMVTKISMEDERTTIHRGAATPTGQPGRRSVRFHSLGVR